MINQEQKNLINKYKEEGKTITEISRIMKLPYNKIYYFLNREKAIKHSNEYYENNKEEINKYKREYSKIYYKNTAERCHL